MDRRVLTSLLTAALWTTGCEPARNVDVQPLPGMERSSVEARLGLPAVAGTWRFAGWELAEGDSASLARDLPRLGSLFIRTQKRDSVGGAYLVGDARAPLAGEVRRDSTVAVVTYLGPGDGRFLTGRVAADTLWVQLTSLLDAESWPPGARVAFVRSVGARPFVRLHGALPPPPPPDTTASVATLPAATAGGGTSAAPYGPAPLGAGTGAPPAPVQALPTPAAPPAASQGPPQSIPRSPSPPSPTERRRDSVTSPPARPRNAVPRTPAPRVQAPTPNIPLLGEPVRDTARDTTRLRR